MDYRQRGKAFPRAQMLAARATVERVHKYRASLRSLPFKTILLNTVT